MRSFTVVAGAEECENASVFHLGDVIRKLRKKRGWDQTELAKKANVNKSTVVNIEKGKPAQEGSRAAIARAFGYTEVELLNLVPVESERHSSSVRSDSIRVKGGHDATGQLLDELETAHQQDLEELQAHTDKLAAVVADIETFFQNRVQNPLPRAPSATRAHRRRKGA